MSTCVFYHNRWFFARTGWVAYANRLLSEEILAMPNPPFWLFDFAKELEFLASNNVGSFNAPSLNAFLTSDERRAVFLELCGRVLERMSKFGDVIPAAEMDRAALGVGCGSPGRDAPGQYYRDYVTGLIELVRGTVGKVSEYIEIEPDDSPSVFSRFTESADHVAEYRERYGREPEAP